MIVLFATVCILAGPCEPIEFKGVFADMDSCGAFADDASAHEATVPTDERRLLRVKAVGCRDERDT